MVSSDSWIWLCIIWKNVVICRLIFHSINTHDDSPVSEEVFQRVQREHKIPKKKADEEQPDAIQKVDTKACVDDPQTAAFKEPLLLTTRY